MSCLKFYVTILRLYLEKGLRKGKNSEVKSPNYLIYFLFHGRNGLPYICSEYAGKRFAQASTALIFCIFFFSILSPDEVNAIKYTVAL